MAIQISQATHAYAIYHKQISLRRLEYISMFFSFIYEIKATPESFQFY